MAVFTLYDDDDYHFSYENMVDWHNGDTVNFYNGGTHNSSNVAGTLSRVKFVMYGSVFRLYNQLYIDGRNINIKVYIDGNQVDVINVPSQYVNGHQLYYTSPPLAMGVHEVTLEKNNSESGYMMFDGLDTDGFLYTPVGYKLPSPEGFWTRIDNTDSKILYSANMINTSGVSTGTPYNGTHQSNQTAEFSAAVLRFYGTRIRIYSRVTLNIVPDFSVVIDGVKYPVTASANNGEFILQFEKYNLPRTIHDVTISATPSQTLSFQFDCIDIDDTGYLIAIPIDKSLPSPDPNWTRISYASNTITYLNFLSYTGYNYNKGGAFTVTFNFKGSGMRLIASANTDIQAKIINIDGINYPYHFANPTWGAVILAEFVNLPNTVHTCTITGYNQSNTNWNFQVYGIDVKGEDKNFQHYVIMTSDDVNNYSYYIPNKNYFDTVNNKFMTIPKEALVNFNNDMSCYITDIKEIFAGFSINSKFIYPFDYINSSNMKILKFIGHSDSVPDLINNSCIANSKFKTDFSRTDKTLIIKYKDVLKIKSGIEKAFNVIDVNNSSVVRIGIESNSIIYGKDFKQIKEDEIKTYGFAYSDLINLEIPFDNVRFIITFIGNIAAATDELRVIKIIRKYTKKIRKLLVPKKDYIIINNINNNSLYIKLNSDMSSLTINKTEPSESYNVKNTIDTF